MAHTYAQSAADVKIVDSVYLPKMLGRDNLVTKFHAFQRPRRLEILLSIHIARAAIFMHLHTVCEQEMDGEKKNYKFNFIE